MNNCSKIILIIGLAVSLHLGLYPTSDIAMSAIAPVVANRPAITTQISTPVRLATDSAGNIYATDPLAMGILKYNSAGSLVQKIVTSKSGGGVAIAQDGTPNARLLVTQGSYVAVINPGTGFEESRFGAFNYANGIAVDNSNNIYVTDSRDNKVYKFNSAYVQQLPVVTILNARPAGIAYDKFNNRLAIANSLAGNIQFYSTAMVLLETVGSRNTDFDYIAPVYPSAPYLTYPQGVSFEYVYNTAVPPAIIGVNRIYIAETFQSNIQVLDGVSPYNRIADIGGYGFVNGKLYVPSDVIIDPYDTKNKRLFVANGGGTLAIYSIDNIDPSIFYNLALTTVGFGSVNGTVTCGENAVCPSTIQSGTPVTLTASANALSSVFKNWAGACTGTTNPCTFTMDADKSLTATFELRKPFYVAGAGYDNLQAAYDAAGSGPVVIKIMAGPWMANVAGAFTAGDATKTITIKGGYDSQFTEPASAGTTTIIGRVNVKAGKVILNNIKVK